MLQAVQKEREEVLKMLAKLDKDCENLLSIRVVGVGSCGSKTVSHMYNSGMSGVEFIAIHTDFSALHIPKEIRQLNIEDRLTKEIGANGKPEIGERAACACREEIAAALKGADLVFIVAGLSSEIATDAAPIVAEIAHGMGCFTVGMVRPFVEAERRIPRALEGIDRLKDKVDSLLVIPTELPDRIANVSCLEEFFETTDEVFRQAVWQISNLINTPGLVNIDFADFSSIMKGTSYIGLGQAKGKNKAAEAAKEAIMILSWEIPFHKARGMVASIWMSPEIDLDSIDTACSMIHNAASQDVDFIWGATTDDERTEDECRVMVIVSDFEE